MLVDDLVAWLVGLLGDASRRRLVKFVVGTAEKRARAAAAHAAVTGTAAELRPGDEKSAEQLAMVINQVFNTGDPRELDLAGGQTVQEALGVGVQVAVLGEPELTGQEVSSADLLGIPAGKIAKCLTAHLVAEIRKAALTGGPLKPLADQINFDAAYLNDRRAAGVLDRVHDGVLAILDRLDGQPVMVTAEEFASDVRALLEALAEQAAHGRLRPICGDARMCWRCPGRSRSVRGSARVLAKRTRRAARRMRLRLTEGGKGARLCRGQRRLRRMTGLSSWLTQGWASRG